MWINLCQQGIEMEDLKSCAFRGVRVQFPFPVPLIIKKIKPHINEALSFWHDACPDFPHGYWRKFMKNGKVFLNAAMLFALCLGSAGLAAAQNRQLLARAQSITGDRFTVSVRTPNGANVYAVTRPSKAMLAAIDQGLGDLFAVARDNRYNKRLSFADYSIFIAKADRQKDSRGAYSPDISVGAGQYSGTDYDQGGYIYAAGMVVAYSPLAFVIAEHTKNFQRVTETVRYEGEHLVLYHNDRRRYNQTADHSQGGSHPILQ